MDNNVRKYELFSGGEKTLINFSIRLGISIYLSSNSQNSINTVILDEVFASLDEDNKGKIYSILNTLKARFDKILVISHTDMQSIFPHIIEFERDYEGTRIAG